MTPEQRAQWLRHGNHFVFPCGILDGGTGPYSVYKHANIPCTPSGTLRSRHATREEAEDVCIALNRGTA